MTDNRYDITGTVAEIGELVRFSQWFAKREVKLRFTEIDHKNNIVEKKAKFIFQNDSLEMANGLRIDDIVQITFSVDGKDIVKDGKTMNFTSLIVQDVSIMSSPSRDTQKDKEALITPEGRDYEKKAKEASDDELAGIFNEDPLLQEWNQRKPEEVKKKEDVDDLPF